MALPGWLQWFDRAANDSTTNVKSRDLLGSKADTANYTVGDTSSSMRYIKALLQAGVAVAGAVNDVGPAVTDFDTNLTEATNDHYNGMLLMFTSGVCLGQAHQIDDYTGASKNVSFATSDQWTDAPANADNFIIIPSAGAYLKKIYDYLAATATGKPNVQEVVIYPVAEDAGTTELADDGTSPAFYPAVAASGTSNSEAAPDVVWSEDIDFEQDGTITLISIYAELEWQSKLTVGGGDASNCYTKMQISRDAGANWVDVTDSFTNPAIIMTARVRAGVGLWISTIVAGANQLALRLVSWTDDTVGGVGRSSCEAQCRSNTYLRITYRKS